ncbi:MAG: hypothetical protein HC849_17640 [Oscillatoriales cyanobacterium RU_3_3]|nr:hypothetical protein [Oscillatoriales cyanobacterium RU_3_3]
MYWLTDENNTRPQKTLTELAANVRAESGKLELVLEIIVKSGLVLEIPATPIERYQLVHYYLLPFIRKRKNVKIIEWVVKIEETIADINKRDNELRKELG